MIVEGLFDGWWMVVSLERDKHFCWSNEIRQVLAGEEYDIETHRGPFKTERQAEEFRWYDHVEGYWSHGLAVYADHCLGCGRWAKVLAFDSAAGWAWRVTECKKCGVIDSRG